MLKLKKTHKNEKIGCQIGNFHEKCSNVKINYLTPSEFLNWQIAAVFGKNGKKKMRLPHPLDYFIENNGFAVTKLTTDNCQLITDNCNRSFSHIKVNKINLFAFY